jgi:hypothetical protein
MKPVLKKGKKLWLSNPNKQLNLNLILPPNQPLVVEMRHISKSFPGIKANDDISFNSKRAKFMPCSARTGRANQP